MTDRPDPDLRARVAALEAELARARASQASGEWLADAVLVHDLDGQILGANRRAAELLGRSVDELLQHDLFALEQTMQGSDRAAARDNWARLEPDTPVTARGRFVARTGPPVPVEFTIVARDDGPQRRIVLVARDIRDRLRVERALRDNIDARVQAETRLSALLASLEAEVEVRTAELRRSNDQLRVEIGERERAEALLVRARARAEAASSAKSRFLMVMSHELRTPLNAILGYADMHIHGLVHPTEPSTPDELLADLQRIRGAGLHLLSHIDDILHMTRLDADERNEVERLELRPFLYQLAEGMRTQLARPEITLSLALAADLGAIDTDPGKLQHILRHLLRNAAKFTHDGRLELQAAPEPGGGVRIDVCDTGIGIPPEQLDLIFVAFAQLDDSPTRRYGGLGLGLALCRRYCDELGGSITVESAVGDGSRFTVRLPVAPPAKLG